MNQETKQLPVPNLTSEQVQVLINYANDHLPTKWGNEILAFIQKVAVEIEKAQQPINAEGAE
jgi:hypothetical protein